MTRPVAKTFITSLLVLLALSTTFMNTISSEIQPLMEARSVTIPQNLPWYPLVFFGDNRPSDIYSDTPPPVFFTALNEINSIYPIATIGLGDHVGYGYESQYKTFYQIMSSTRLENLWFAMGNHEVVYPNGWSYWSKYIGPLYVIRDNIPAWRIAVLNTEVDIAKWGQMLTETYRDLGARGLLMAFHRPVYPGVNHNIKTEHNSTIHEYMNRYGWPTLVVQAHWHGWAKYEYNNTLWLISGSTGAPLYSVSNCQQGSECVADYNYLWLILRPDKTYTYAPVSVTRGALKVIAVNSTTFLVENTKYDVYGNPVDIPVRLKYRVASINLYVVLLAPANSIIVVSIDPSRGNYLYTNATDYYAYFVRDDPYRAIVIQPGDDHGLSNYGLIGEISAEAPENITPITPTTTVSTTTTSRTTTTTQSSTTTQATTHTPTGTETNSIATPETPTSPSATEGLKEGDKGGTTLILLVFGVLAGIAIYLTFRLKSKH